MYNSRCREAVKPYRKGRYKMIKIFNKNYLDCGDVKFDLIFTDIPYNIGKDAYASNPQWWKNGIIKEGYSKKADTCFFDTDINFDIYEWLEWCYNHLKENGKIITFLSIEQLSLLILNHGKFKKYIPLIFIKNNSAEALKVNMRIVGACEYGVILYKNKLGYFNNEHKMIKNWFTFDRIAKKKHPNQKPLDLCTKLLKLFADKNYIICDTCMGSGQILKACKLLNLDCYGFEINKEYFEIAKANLEEGEVRDYETKRTTKSNTK